MRSTMGVSHLEQSQMPSHRRGPVENLRKVHILTTNARNEYNAVF